MLYGELQTVPFDGKEYQGFRFRISNPPKTAILRLPTSAEMIERIDNQKSILRSIGRGKTQSEPVPNPEADLRLFEQLRVAGADFDEFEARTSISRLTEVDVTASSRAGDIYRITLKTPFCSVIHRLKMPTEKVLHFYRRGIVASTSMRHGQEELKYRASAAVEFYDAVFDSTEGYAPGVEPPAHHKFRVASDLSDACQDFDPLDFDPNS